MAPPSALIGQPPLTDIDYLIVRGFLLEAGMLDKVDPKKGFPSPIKRPPPDQYISESLRDKFIVSIVLCMVFMLVPTITRMILRCRNAKLHLGWDDIFVVMGCVSPKSLQAPILKSYLRNMLIVGPRNSSLVWPFRS